AGLEPGVVDVAHLVEQPQHLELEAGIAQRLLFEMHHVDRTPRFGGLDRLDSLLTAGGHFPAPSLPVLDIGQSLAPSPLGAFKWESSMRWTRLRRWSPNGPN